MIENTERSERTTIEQNVMRRVHTIHQLRPLVSGSALAVLLGALALYGIGREVWVGMVFQNAPHSLGALFSFSVYAFEHTRLLVQALSLVTLAAVIYLARETAKLLTNTFVLAQV